MIVAETHLFGYGGIDPGLVRSVFAEALLGMGGPVDGEEMGMSLAPIVTHPQIDLARSTVLSLFLDGKSDVCVMVDRDIEFSPGTLLGLALRAHRSGACVSPLIAQRGGMGVASRPVGEIGSFPFGEDKLVSAEYLGAGFLAIPRRQAEQVRDRLLGTDLLRPCRSAATGDRVIHDFFRPLLVDGVYLPEDWSFSHRVREVSHDALKIWSRPMDVIHHGSYPYTVGDVLAHRSVARGELS